MQTHDLPARNVDARAAGASACGARRLDVRTEDDRQAQFAVERSDRCQERALAEHPSVGIFARPGEPPQTICCGLSASRTGVLMPLSLYTLINSCQEPPPDVSYGPSVWWPTTHWSMPA
jgi:hypothetical protein